jgi:hypothetical protein
MNGELTDKTLSVLARLKGLSTLSLLFTRVTQQGIQEFEKKRPDVGIEYFSSLDFHGTSFA